MEKQIFSYKSKQLNALKAETCTLRLIVGMESLSWAVSDEQGNVLGLQSWQFTNENSQFQAVYPDIRMILSQEQPLSWHYAHRHVAIYNKQVTFVPRRLFRVEDRAKYFKVLLAQDTTCDQHDTWLEPFDCHMVFNTEKGLLDIMNSQFSSFQPKHLADPLLLRFLRWAAADQYAVFVNLRNQQMQVAVFDRRNLAFYNSFDCTKASDVLYYTLLAFDQFKQDPILTPLHLSGNILEDSEVYKMLYRYFRNIRFLDLPTGHALPQEAADLPAHFWFDLWAI